MEDIQIVSTLQNKLNQKKSVHHSSSTVFFGIVNLDTKIDTEVSLLNHFLLKRGISDVSATFELRSLDGSLLQKFNMLMQEPKTYAIQLSKYVKGNFIGSVYVFFQSNENLAVPFCAVTSVIKAKNSICGVHTYGRRLEQNELGADIDLTETIETGWTLRDNKDIKSFGVLHGGQFELSLDLRVECTDSSGSTKSANILKQLKPFETLILVPQDLIDGLIEHLGGKKGHAKVFIKGLSGVFPRMLCGNYTVGASENHELTLAKEIQFTHTNFDFSTISQPDASGYSGYYNQPNLPKGYGIVYPVETEKNILIGENPYITNSIHHIEVEPMKQVEILSEHDNLPSRFVSAAVGIWEECILESECSTGTFTEDYLKVPCHWHWGLLKPGFENGESVLSIVLNKFNRKENLSRSLKLRVFSEEHLLLDEDIVVSESQAIKVMDMLPRKLTETSLWYVLSGDSLEDLNIFSTFYPIKKSGFTEHAF